MFKGFSAFLIQRNKGNIRIMLEVAKSPESQDNFQHVVSLLEDSKKFFYRLGDVEIEKKLFY